MVEVRTQLQTPAAEDVHRTAGRVSERCHHLSALTSPSPKVRASEPPSLRCTATASATPRWSPSTARLGDVAEPAHESLLESLADEPATVLCDLSGVTGPPDPGASGCWGPSPRRSASGRARRWGSSVPAPDLRESLGRQPDSEHLVIADRRRRVLAGLARRPRPTVVRAPLPPVARSARAARDLVSRTCLDWECSAQVGAATLGGQRAGHQRHAARGHRPLGLGGPVRALDAAGGP